MHAYFRLYQLEWLWDDSTERIVVKSRQIGYSDVCLAFEMVFTSSGLVRLLNRHFRDLGIDWKILPHNCNIISKRDKDAKDVIKKAKKWIERMRTIQALRPWLAQPDDGGGWSATSIAFKKSGFCIGSETQSEGAGRSSTGHLYMDEFGFYPYEAAIWTGAIPSTESLDGLRVSIISTPNGTSNQFFRVYTNDQKMFNDYSRHKTDLKEAIEQGFPQDFEKMRAKKTPDNFAQENMCDFLGASDEYFSADMLDAAYAECENIMAVRHLGVDAASTVDTTALVEIDKEIVDGQEVFWIGDAFILSRTPYETNDTDRNFKLGQDVIVDALLLHLNPDSMKVDVTGDKARQVRGMKNLYNVVVGMGGPTPIRAQTITKEWKDRWVPQVKTALQTGRLRFKENRKDYVYTPRNEGKFKGSIKYDQRITRSVLDDFMDVSWQVTGFDFLRSDFQKVHKKWIGPDKTTFDTTRDSRGHGDSFWAAVIGFSGIAAKYAYGISDKPAPPVQDNYIQPEYQDYF